MARRKDLCQNKRYWQDKGSSHDHVRDWEKNVNEWSKRIENMFETGNFTDMGVRPEQVWYDSSVFEIRIDTQHFSLEQLNVKVVGNKLTIMGNHELKQNEYGSISRQFRREFDIPEDIKTKTLESSLSDDGFLTLRADVEGADKDKKTGEIKFEQRKED